MAHITGGGIDGNLPRIFNKKLTAVIHMGSWPLPPVFELIRKLGRVPVADMRKTFNMGIGYVIVVRGKSSRSVVTLLKEYGYSAYLIGSIEKGGRERIRYV
jgi:phosphoribosylformylglycinamidine cyclo-ligase